MVVFCGNKSKHEELLDHDIVMAVEDDFLALLNKIQEAIEKIERKEIESFDANSYQDRFTDFRRSASATEKRLNLSCISETVIERVDQSAFNASELDKSYEFDDDDQPQNYPSTLFLHQRFNMLTRLTELGGDELQSQPKYKINADLLIENEKKFVDGVLEAL